MGHVLRQYRQPPPNLLVNEQGEIVFKIILMGDGGTGKSAYVKKMETGEFVYTYTATCGASTHVLRYNTTYGPVKFEVWDTAGQERFGSMREAYYINSSGALIFFDVTSRATYKNVSIWHNEFIRTVESANVIVVGNKVDAKNRKVLASSVGYPRKNNCGYVEISVKANYNIEKPLLLMLKRLIANDLELTSMPSMKPAEIVFDEELRKKVEHELAVASNLPLPDELDEDDTQDL